MKSLLVGVERWEDAFLPWRMSADSLWLTTDISELRALVELQSMRAMKQFEAYNWSEHAVPDSTLFRS